MKKITNCLMATVFITFLLASLLLQVVIPEKNFSDLENRFLNQMPKFSLEALFEGDYTSDFEGYIEDQFPFRDEWIVLKNEFERLFGKKEANGVYFGKDDYYFEIRKSYDEERFLKNINYVNQFNTKLEEMGISTLFFPIYSSHMYYSDKLPAYAPFVDERKLVETLKSELGVEVLDSFEDLMQHTDEELYFKSDHHWNQLGAYYAYVALADRYGFEPLPLSAYEKKCSSENFVGTLYSKAPLFAYPGDEFCYYEDSKLAYEVYIRDDEETFNSMYFTENLTKKDKYVTFLSGNHGEVHIKSNANTGRKLVMFKDSYSHALAPLLAAHFDEIVLLDLRYFNYPLIPYLEEFNPSDVLFSYHVMWFSDDKNLFKLR